MRDGASTGGAEMKRWQDVRVEEEDQSDHILPWVIVKVIIEDNMILRDGTMRSAEWNLDHYGFTYIVDEPGTKMILVQKA